VLQQFQPGDILIFQIESGYALIRVLEVEDGQDNGPVWHISGFADLFMDVDSADEAIANFSSLTVAKPHMALTNRAFESTHVAKMANVPITAAENDLVSAWRNDPERKVSDRSFRLLLGLR
jgi:hypothetical protein